MQRVGEDVRAVQSTPERLRHRSGAGHPENPGEEQARHIESLSACPPGIAYENSQDEMRRYAGEQPALGREGGEHSEVDCGQHDGPTARKEDKVRADDLRATRRIVEPGG